MQQELYIINKLTTDLQTLLPMQEEYQRNLDKKIRLEFSYNSNHIEGNTLTYGETELLLIFGKTEGQHEFREYEEMEAHDVAFKIIKEWAADAERPLTEMAIKNLNETILVKPYWKEALTPDGQSTRRQIKVGDYKEYPNHVQLQNGEMFYYASPAETPIQMGELIDWYRSEEENKELHPVALAALLHYKFVRIHPFDDGNGRISRLLMNYVLLKNNLPPVIIKSLDKKNYLFTLNQADIGNIEAFITYIAEQLIWSLQLYIKAAKGESLDEAGDLDKKLFFLKKKLGEDVEAKVEMKYGEEAIRDVITHTISPLVKVWDNELNKFDDLFNDRYASISFGSIIRINTRDEIVSTNLTQAVKQLWISLKTISEKDYIKEINFTVNFTGIRNRNNGKKLNAGKIIFFFYTNAYEVITSSSNTKINKLYHQSLTEEEINTITESLGNWFYEKVEQALAE